MSWFITNFIATFLLPPLSLLLIIAAGLVLLHRGSKLAKIFLLSGTVLLWITCTPYFSDSALRLLESRTTPLGNSLPDADAIVILGGGTYFRAPEYGGRDTVNNASLERLRYGAWLQRKTGKPILVTGGNPLGNTLPESIQMRTALEQDFHATVNWTEDTSNNTLENAYHSYNILEAAGIHKIYLVTHAWHMPRASLVFRQAGFEVIEAPTAFTTRYRMDLLTFLPHAAALRECRIFIHEVIGLLWYRLKLALIS